jgi:uncharacterized membrane protein
MKLAERWNRRSRLDWLAHNPATAFLVLSLFFGLLFIFRLAPFNGTDEFTHFPRVYQITDGTLWENKLPDNQYGGLLPMNINTMINAYRDLSRQSSGRQYQLHEEQLNNHYRSLSQPGVAKVPAIFTAVVLYPPWAYLPSVVGVLTARLLHVPLIWYVYLGRIFSLFAWMAVTWLAIRLIPQGKWFLVAVALLPTSLSQAATISADGLINGISWLIIAAVLAVFSRTILLNTKKLVLLTVLATSLSVLKQGYWMIALLPLIIPREYFRTTLQSKLWKAITLSMVLVTSALLALRSSTILSGVVLSPIAGSTINMQLQTHYLLQHPLLFGLRALSQPFTKNFDTIYLGIFGILTNRLIYLSILVIGLLAFGLVLGLQQTKAIAALVTYRRRLRIAALVIIIGTYLLIALSFYIGESQVGGSVINSIYGRYLLPLLPLLLLFPITQKTHLGSDTSLTSLQILTLTIIGLAATGLTIGQ